MTLTEASAATGRILAIATEIQGLAPRDFDSLTRLTEEARMLYHDVETTLRAYLGRFESRKTSETDPTAVAAGQALYLSSLGMAWTAYNIFLREANTWAKRFVESWDEEVNGPRGPRATYPRS